MSETEHTSLKKAKARSERRRMLISMALVLPLALFLLVTFLAPLYEILSQSVRDEEVGRIWPRVSVALADWNGTVPEEPVFAALAADMKASQAEKTTALASRRLNYALSGGRTLISSTARKIAGLEAKPENGWKQEFISLNAAWDDAETWQAIYQASGPVSTFYLLAAFDRKMNARGEIVQAPKENRIYLAILLRTFTVAATVTAICLLLAFPVAYFLANGPKRAAALVMVLVLLPLWTSLLVRTAAWVVLLQDQGLINKALEAMHLISGPLPLIFNRVGVVIAMVHVSLPYMVLPIYATMAAIKPEYMRAAISLGAKPRTAFRRIYLPLTSPGLAAGTLLVFIMSLGYYITPALVGGASDQMVSYFISYYTTDAVNWGLAGALAAILILATALLYLVYSKLTSAKGVSFG